MKKLIVLVAFLLATVGCGFGAVQPQVNCKDVPYPEMTEKKTFIVGHEKYIHRTEVEVVTPAHTDRICVPAPEYVK